MTGLPKAVAGSCHYPLAASPLPRAALSIIYCASFCSFGPYMMSAGDVSLLVRFLRLKTMVLAVRQSTESHKARNDFELEPLNFLKRSLCGIPLTCTTD